MEPALRSILSWWDAVGVDVPEIKPAPGKRPSAPKTQEREPSRQQAAQVATPPKPAVVPSVELARRAKSLSELESILKDFDAGEMSDHARQVVFARGNPEADIMVIGEAPGRDEDVAGKPFVGRPGELLDKMFASIGLGEDAIYITNVVNWHTPKNRDPKPEEVALCKPFILRHIELVSPKYIVLVGGLSLSTLTDGTSIMKNRGQWTNLSVNGKDVPTLPIYHPEFLLLQPSLKKDAWHDMLSLRARLEN